MLTITVAQDGSGDFASIAEAVLAVPYVEEALVQVGPGLYREKLVCEKRCITLRGAGADRTRLVWGDGGKLPHKDGRPTHTFRSYTAFFSGGTLCVEDMTIENDAGPGAQAGQAVAAANNKIESAQDIQTWFTGYGLDVDGASITADKVKIPRKWDDSFSAFNGVVQQSGMDLTRYKGKTVEKWTALIPAASRGDVSSYGVLLVYRKKAVGAYLLEKPSGVVTGLKDAQTAMALQEAEQVSGEDFSGDWGERHDEELTDEQARQTSGEDFSGDWGERHDEELASEQAQQTSGEPENAQSQPVQYTDLPLDAEGYPVE